MCASRVSRSFKISIPNKKGLVEEAFLVSELVSKFKWHHFRRRYGGWTQAYDFGAYDFGAVIHFWQGVHWVFLSKMKITKNLYVLASWGLCQTISQVFSTSFASSRTLRVKN